MGVCWQVKHAPPVVVDGCRSVLHRETQADAEVSPEMAGKSVEQRLAETEERIRQLQARKQTLSAAIRQQERKDRTRRLIQLGGILARLGVDTVEKAQALQYAVEANPEVHAWLRQVAARGKFRQDG